MQLWTSGEVMMDIRKPYSAARQEIERAVNSVIEPLDLGPGVSEWALIFIIMDEDDPNYQEIKTFDKRTRVVEFRLKVDHHAFKNADALIQRQLLAAALVRSIELSTHLPIADFDTGQFRTRVMHVLKMQQWI